MKKIILILISLLLTASAGYSQNLEFGVANRTDDQIVRKIISDQVKGLELVPRQVRTVYFQGLDPEAYVVKDPSKGINLSDRLLQNFPANQRRFFNAAINIGGGVIPNAKFETINGKPLPGDQVVFVDSCYQDMDFTPKQKPAYKLFGWLEDGEPILVRPEDRIGMKIQVELLSDLQTLKVTWWLLWQGRNTRCVFCNNRIHKPAPSHIEEKFPYIRTTREIVWQETETVYQPVPVPTSTPPSMEKKVVHLGAGGAVFQGQSGIETNANALAFVYQRQSIELTTSSTPIYCPPGGKPSPPDIPGNPSVPTPPNNPTYPPGIGAGGTTDVRPPGPTPGPGGSPTPVNAN